MVEAIGARVKERGIATISIAMANLEATKANLLARLVTLGNVMPLFEAVNIEEKK